MESGGNSWERELSYYRRECNDLGARLLRLQEEQSQAFREARRSRTVVKLLRETYRLGDFAATTHDVGGAMLELVIDNTLCDRAALLREEKPDSGQFVMLHAIGLPESALSDIVEVPHPPAFLYTSETAPGRGAEQIVAAMGVPYVLWAYDRGSRHALVIGNRFESNVNRPFEPGDQELIESALSIYLDVLYRKHAEAQLRQAKQAAESARDARMAFMADLACEIRGPINALIDLCQSVPGLAVPGSAVPGSAVPGSAVPGLAVPGLAVPGLAVSGLAVPKRAFPELPGFNRNAAAVPNSDVEIMKLARYVQSLVDEAAGQEAEAQPVPDLNLEWIAVDEIVHGGLRTAYATSIRSSVEIECRLPKRRSAIRVDRGRMGRVIQQLLSAAVKATPAGGVVRVSAGRRSDGGLEIFFCSRGAGPLAVAHPVPEKTLDGAAWSEGASLEMARRMVEAHNGTLTVESSAFLGTNVRLILPQHATRDMSISGVGDD